MKKFALAILGLVGSTFAIQTTHGCHDKCNYDYHCKAAKLENCLQNDIALYGPNVVLVNLDNRCKVEKYEREGIFL